MASLLGGLFGEDESETHQTAYTSTMKAGGQVPVAPRNNTNLCGIYNQGATCYLNSLLQSLLMTPEFREALFDLGENEVGKLTSTEKKARIIPLQLQRLFSRMLLVDAQAVSTVALTDSFGWTNSEELIQHDVQELSRILLGAVEQSLVGTSGSNLVKDLYHGQFVNQIICQTCGRCSERQEDFLDLCVTVWDSIGLEQGLQRNYVMTETLDGNNKYFCEGCGKLSHAEKGAKIRHLPPILSISMLRFNFDPVKMERYKETGKFSFPHSLNMAAYCENLSTAGDTEYELFSVIIHRGSTHGGHYHAYIRDVDGLGTWQHPDDQPLQVPTDPSTGHVDFIECDSPVELVTAILSKMTARGMAIDTLGSEIMKQTGVSWNKRFKPKYGAMNKFLKKYNDKFELNQSTNYVYLRDYTSPRVPQIVVDKPQEDEKHSHSSQPRSPDPPPGYCWFNFDDANIRPISSQEIEKQFSGKESAYMLFYRRKSLSRPRLAFQNPAYALSDHHIEDVFEENARLQKEREEYDQRVNSITVHVYFGHTFYFENGALQTEKDPLYIDVSIDHRKSIEELREEIERASDTEVRGRVLHKLRDLPAGWHMYEQIDHDTSRSVYDFLSGGDKIMVWDGCKISGVEVSVGAEHEPILLHVSFGDAHSMEKAFRQSLLASELLLYLAGRGNIGIETASVSRVITKGDMTKIFKVLHADLSKTLRELNFENGDHVVCEDIANTGGKLAEQEASQQANMVSFIVENRCKRLADSSLDYPVLSQEVDKQASVGELKAMLLSRPDVCDDIPEGGGRLRVEDDDKGLSAPLHEEQSVEEAGLKQGQKLVLEVGGPPTSSQISLSLSGDDVTWVEVVVDKSSTLKEVLAIADLDSEKYHLEKTNWCGEAGGKLDDLEATMQDLGLLDGNQLLVVNGSLPPKGYMKLPVWLLPDTPQCSVHKDMWGKKHLGEVLISKTASIEELRQEIRLHLLPDVPRPATLRLRLLEDNFLPTTVLRGANTLQRAKVTSSSVIGVQQLPHDEHLSQNSLLLCVALHIPGTREYEAALELSVDVGAGGTQPLKRAVAEAMSIPVRNVCLAKHWPEKHEWTLIRDMGDGSKVGNGGKGNKKKTTTLKNAPYFLKDGDTIGVKDTTVDHDKDFSTVQDDEGKKRLKEEEEEKRRKRAESRKYVSFEVGAGDYEAKPARREVGISIHVDNFS